MELILLFLIINLTSFTKSNHYYHMPLLVKLKTFNGVRVKSKELALKSKTRVKNKQVRLNK